MPTQGVPTTAVLTATWFTLRPARSIRSPATDVWGTELGHSEGSVRSTGDRVGGRIPRSVSHKPVVSSKVKIGAP